VKRDKWLNPGKHPIDKHDWNKDEKIFLENYKNYKRQNEIEVDNNGL